MHGHWCITGKKEIRFFFFVKCKKFVKSSKNTKSAKILSTTLISMQNLSRDVYSYSYESFIYLTPSYTFVANILKKIIGQLLKLQHLLIWYTHKLNNIYCF